MKQAQLIVHVEPPVLLMVCSDGTIDENSYAQYLEQFRSQRHRVRSFLVYTGGAHFDARQRARTVKACENLPIRFALLTDSIVARASITAFAWLLPQRVRAFAEDGLAEALSYLEVQESEREALGQRFRVMVNGIGRRLPDGAAH